MDIVKRLRQSSANQTQLDAADEIERLRQLNKTSDELLGDWQEIGWRYEVECTRLRAALERIADGCDLSNEAQKIARETLQETE